MAVSKHLLLESGIHHRLKSCKWWGNKSIFSAFEWHFICCFSCLFCLLKRTYLKWWLVIFCAERRNQKNTQNRMTHKNQRKDNEENTACCYISVNHKKAKHASKPYNPFSCCLLSFTFSEGHTNIFCFCWFWLLIRLCLWVKCGTSLLFVMLRS